MFKALRPMVVIGTRPELIKLAPVVRELKERGHQPFVVFTEQHADLVEDIAPFFGIVPDARLGVMREGQSLSQLLARLLAALDEVIDDVKPDVVVVQGDTTSVLGGALAAFHRQVPVVHVEAGLRTGSLHDPFPEEGNRVLAARITDVHFAPTERAARNLLAEGVHADNIVVTGNTSVDAILQAAERIPHEGGPQNKVLVTMHRRESQGAPMRAAARGIVELARLRPDLEFVWPVHPSPRVKEVVYEVADDVENITLCEPMGYAELVSVLKQSVVVLSDSGGLQEEAPALDVPVLVLRESTERQEAVEAGAAKLVGTSTARIVEETLAILDDADAWYAMANAMNPFGDGSASVRIVDTLEARFVPRQDTENEQAARNNTIETAYDEKTFDVERPEAGPGLAL